MSYFQTKLQWLCEELKERENREKSLRHQLMLCRQQLRNMTENKESELQCLFEQIERQEQLLEEIHREKRGVLCLIFLCLYLWHLRVGGKTEKTLISLASSSNHRISKFLSFPCLLSPYLHFWVQKRKLFLPENFSFNYCISVLCPSIPFVSLGHLHLLFW